MPLTYTQIYTRSQNMTQCLTLLTYTQPHNNDTKIEILTKTQICTQTHNTDTLSGASDLHTATQH